MARERAAKRSRKEEPPSSAAGPSEAASGQQDLNPFARLPDALVQNIFSKLDALKAYEESKLWAVDRRFRQLLPGVLWTSLTVDADGRAHDDSEDIVISKQSLAQAVRRSASFQKQLQRFTDRLGTRQMLGVEFLSIGSVLPNGLRFSFEDEEDDRKEMMMHGQRITDRIISLLAAAATAAVPPESIDFGVNWYYSRCSSDRQRELGLDPVSLKHVAASFLAALLPARLRCIKTFCFKFGEALASVVTRECAPSLQKLHLYTSSLLRQNVARVVAAFSELRSLEITIEGGEALQEIAGCAHLEELEVFIRSVDEHVAEALAAIAAGPSGARLRKLVLSAYQQRFMDSQCLAPVLRLDSLEKLSIAVGPDCAALLPALGRLERLKALDLTLNLSGSTDGGAGLLRAGAELLRSKAGQGLEKCTLRVRTAEQSGPVDAAALSDLVEAVLASSSVVDLELDCAFPANSLATLPCCGPRLRRLSLSCWLPSGDDAILELAPFRGLLALSPESHPRLSVYVGVKARHLTAKSSSLILSSWFRDSKVVRLGPFIHC